MVNRIYTPDFSESFFLFGARGTGKTSLLQQWFGKKASVLWLDFLDPQTEDAYRMDPARLKREIASQKPKWVVMDEVQKIPKILDVVHSQIESGKNQTRFALTGSSARKLKRGSANLLAGRAFVNHVFPLIHQEWHDVLELSQVLRFGSLPKLIAFKGDAQKKDFLRSYALTYLNEEVRMEQLVRNLDPFRFFLEISAQMNGKQVNASKVAKQVGVDTVTVQSYYQILEDTWMGFLLPAYHRSIKKSQRQTPKFYWFDIGVQKALERSLDAIPTPGTAYYGEVFEHFLVLEIFRLNQILKKDFQLSYYQTHGMTGEVDLVLSRGRRKPILIEIKSTSRIDSAETKKLNHYHRELGAERSFYVSQDPSSQRDGDVLCCGWQEFLKKMPTL